MSYGQWKIDTERTIKEFGYDPSTLTYGSKKPVKCICESCGIVSNKHFRESNGKHICKSIIDGKKKCFKCNQFKLVEEFSKNRRTFDGYQKCCKQCFANYDSVKRGYNKKSDILKRNLKVYLESRISYLEKKSNKKSIPFDLDKTFIYELYLSQKGKCYFTGIDIKHNPGCHQHDSISIERLNPVLGYVKTNVVLAAFAINSFKGMMNEEEFKMFLKDIIPRFQEYVN